MKKLIVLLAMFSSLAFAEATFDQIEGLIQQKNYAAAEAGLEVIIQNHPKSAKAFYAMAQAQAGLGNLEKAQKALNIATGLNPTLDFAPASSVSSLKQAITPQTAKIETIEESHALRNFVLFAMFAGFAVAMYFLYSVYARKQEEEQAAKAERDAKFLREEAERQAQRKREHMEMLAKQDAERKAELAAAAALKAHKNYGHERFDPANPDKLKSVKQFKEETAAAELREAHARAEAAEAEARRANLRATYNVGAPAPAPTTTVVHTSSNDGLLTGMIIGNMMSGSHHDHHDTTIIRETVREVPAPSKSSTWDDTTIREEKSSSWDTPAPSRSSSWDDSSSSSSSSSWSSSSSDSSSSWDSGSSSSDSSSSSSWD